MCGLAGFWQSSSGKTGVSFEVIAGRMTAALTHRGPDDAGVWVDDEAGLALGHRRLSVVDLSPAGHQPMLSACGRYVIAFNGEIYNHLELRAELERLDSGLRRDDGSDDDFRWRGHSDTETLLACFAAWGVEQTLQRCVGMFAIALWDCQTRTLTLARDRLGEKPLYYGWVGQGPERAFVFGSELKALRAYPGFANAVNREALAEYLRFCYVPAPLSIYEDIYKLEPGCLLRMTGAPRLSGDDAFEITRWWSLNDVIAAGEQSPITDDADAVQALETCLGDAVRAQSLADVPLGAFLSGGVDSSTIVALMQQQAREEGGAPVKTFTIGFDEQGFDEAPHARAVARHLGTDHHEMRVNAQMAMDVIAELPWMYDEPFADSSQIPTHLICRAARVHVTVALSGDGGDELFGGYNRYLWGPRIWNRLSWLPHPIRRSLGHAIQTVPVASWDALSGFAGVSRLGDKAHKLAARLGSVRDMDDLYWSLVSEWSDPGSLVIGGSASLRRGAVDPPTKLFDPSGSPRAFGPRDDNMDGGSHDARMLDRLGPVERMMFRDSCSYLPDDILCKVDRAAMACSLETRVPFLDHRVVELAWRLPMDMKIRNSQGKWALRQVLYKYVPRELIERPKAGFAIPVGQWLRGPLRDWAESLLSEQRLIQEGYLHAAPIRQAWAEHLSGKRDWTGRIWTVLMFQAWLERELA